jgi:hypothetical protein
MKEYQKESEQKTCLVTADNVYTFSGDVEGPDLLLMLDMFHQGQSSPSQLFIEPAFAYAKQLMGRGKVEPLAKAKAVFSDHLEKGYEPEWQILLEGMPDEQILGKGFETVAIEVMVPLFEGADG